MTPALRSDAWLAGSALLSVVVHAMAVGSLRLLPERDRGAHPRPVARIEFTVQAPRLAPPVADEPPPVLSPVTPSVRRAVVPRVEAASGPQSPASLAAPVGVPLVSAGVAPGAATATGAGAPPSGPVAPAPASLPAPPPAPRAQPSAPAVVAVKDLGVRPVPPSLDAALRRNYPVALRNKGMGGTARVRGRIDPDGVLRYATVLDESLPGFGAACHRTVAGSRWSPPRDQKGRQVATEIRYTCRFVVEG